LSHKNGKKARLDEDMDFESAYWFAYISTTTVGLGDFYLEPEVVTGFDLVYFPIIILIGFTFLSAFLAKFSEFGQAHMKRRLVDSILATMDGIPKETVESSPEISPK
jgi:hypothetical protein